MKPNSKNNDLKKNGDVLICVPRTKDGGGANYFNSIKYLLPSNIVYFYRGKPNWPISQGLFRELFRIINDYVSYIYILVKKKYKIIHINTFFGGKGLYRDVIFLLLAKIMRKKVIVFFRGWDWKFSAKENNIFFRMIRFFYLKPDVLIVLSGDEKQQLRSWGYSKLIFFETTTVDWRLVQGISVYSIANKYNKNPDFNLLFLSRVHKEKGIYEVLEAFQILQKKYLNLRLTIAGKGQELENVKKFVINHNLANILFLGFVSGNEKKSIYENAHIFLLPSYSEGMPGAVLEAFAFGLPVVATNVGGLKDIFKNQENGFIVEKRNPIDLENKIDMLLSNLPLMKTMALNNHNYAMDKFISTKVAKRIQIIYNSLLK